jgi:hypothetical protein
MFVVRSNTNLPSRLQHFVLPDAEGYGSCGDKLDPELHEAILADLIQRLTDAERPADAMLVAAECHRRFPESPYCVAASAEAFYKLGRNSEARTAAEKVIRRGPYDAKMEATISHMRALLALIDAEEQRRRLTR